MTTRLSAALLIALAAVACGSGDKSKENAASASSDTTLRRDTSGMTAPAATPTTSTADSSRMHSSLTDSAASRRGHQTQSGVTDKAGHSTLGPAIKRTRPDQNKPVMAKGDTLSPTPGVSTDSLSSQPSPQVQTPATTPPPFDTTMNRSRDTTHTDSVRPNPPAPADSTHADTTKP